MFLRMAGVYGPKTWSRLNYTPSNLLNSFPNEKISAWSKLKVFANDKSDVTEMMIALFGGLENTVEKGEISAY